MGQKYIIAHDLGTSGDKAALYSTEGKLIVKAYKYYNTYYPKTGWFEQNPIDWWNAVIETTRKLITSVSINKKDIKCIVLSGHSMGIVPVDAKGNLLKKMVPLWNDSRAIDQAESVLRIIGNEYWYNKTGAGFRPENHSVFKLVWLKEKEPDIFNSTFKFLPTKGYIILKLTGNFVTDYSDASISGLMDIKERRYSKKILDTCGLPLNKMPVIKNSTDQVGRLTLEASKILGLSEDVQIVNGAVDNVCTAIGAGTIKEERVYIYIGSSSWIAAASSKPLLDKKTKLLCYAHAIPKLYLSQVSIFSTGSTLDWYKDILCEGEKFEAGEDNVYEIIEKKAASSPLGSNNILFIPSFRGGATVNPNPYLRGALLGLELFHNKNDINRAVLEGISYELALALRKYEYLGVKPENIIITGGGSKSRFWRKIMTDIFGINTVLTNVRQETAAFGAAAIGAVGMGMWKNFDNVDYILKKTETLFPDYNNYNKYKLILHKFEYAVEKVAEINKHIHN
jgi:xylulokinase